MKTIFSTPILISCILAGCSDNTQTTAVEQAVTPTPVHEKVSESAFSIADAKQNLSFSKAQYLKLIANVEQNKDLEFASVCEKESALCFPRSEEEEKIFMEKPEKWTNGFYPGLLWKLLSVSDQLDDFTEEQKNILEKTALHYQAALKSESQRGNTHDLGFILYDSYGEALEFSGLSEEKRKEYLQILADGRATLATRFSPEYKVIKSWDALPSLPTKYSQDGEILNTTFELAAPWSYPVIVDNLMNLDFLFDSDEQKYAELAFSHAETTQKNHYYYLTDDTNKERPIAYHLIDYANMKPGNWQGLGSISAWARGQAWSLYGFVTVVEAAQKKQLSEDQVASFENHLDSLYNAISYLLKDDKVPLWDFLADQDDAYVLAENMDASTTYYSRILDLCDHEIPRETLPYKGFRPILIDDSLLTEDELARLKTLKSVTGEDFVVDGKIAPCGTKPYDLSGRSIPKDTSAAAIMASGLYRFAQITNNKEKAAKYSELADKIMAELTAHYLTSKDKHANYELGFVLANATGNLPNTSEINTSILYADFFFIEANIRKMQLAQ